MVTAPITGQRMCFTYGYPARFRSQTFLWIGSVLSTRHWQSLAGAIYPAPAGLQAGDPSIITDQIFVGLIRQK